MERERFAAVERERFVVYVDMVGDVFHAGHVNFLRQARALGAQRCGSRKVWLKAGIHTDETVRSYKRDPVFSMPERIEVVAACRLVDEVIPAAPLRASRAYLETIDADLVVHGDDFDDELLMSFYGDAIDMGIFATVPYTTTVDGVRPISTTAAIERVAGGDVLR